tara:strand:+ start:141 stop:1124 length:984 start_codon:yes stop_codon:yes gene_type:complete
MTFNKVDRPCGMPDPQWWEDNCKVKSFRTVNAIGFKVRPIDELKNENEAGQKLNPARSQGIDFQNVNALQLSFVNQGFDTTKMPPIILTDGQVIDGNTRVEALRNIEQKFICVYEVEVKDGFTIDDAYDEIGLGMNNHLASKPMQKADCEKRLALFFERLGEENTEKGIQWFTTFDHPFTKEDVKGMIDKVISKKRFADTMSPFNAKSAKKWLENNNHESDVVMLNAAKTKTSAETYLLRAFGEVLTHFNETSEIKPIVGFLSGFDAESANEARKEAEKKAKILNKAINNLVVKAKEAHSQGEDFELIKLNQWMPQVTGKEDDLVTV